MVEAKTEIICRSLDVTTITCRTNETSGLKAQRTLAPANARYAKRQMLWGRKLRAMLYRQDNRIAVMAGQKILGSRRGSIMLCSVLASEVLT
jgi:hypothetical protein